MTDSNFFKRSREVAKLTRFQAAVKIGVTPSAIQAWEGAGTPPRLSRAAAIAKAYGIPEKRVTDAIVQMSKQPTA